MRNRVFIRWAAVLLLALFLVACSGKSHDAAPKRPATTQDSPTTTAAPNPDVIPPVITVAYVNAVLAVLDRIDGDATRSIRTSLSVSPSAKADIRAIYNDPLYGQEITMASESLKGAIYNVRPHAGNRITLTTRLLTGSHSCIFVEVETNFSSVFVHPTRQAASEYYELEPKQSGIDPGGLNPTPWAFAVNEAFLSPTPVQSPCADN